MTADAAQCHAAEIAKAFARSERDGIDWARAYVLIAYYHGYYAGAAETARLADGWREARPGE